MLFAQLADPLQNAGAAEEVAQTWPRLVALARIDKQPGAEPIVTVGQGASTTFFGIFAVRQGRLVRLETPNRSTFGLGASRVANGTDCWHGPGSGEVVSSFAQGEPRGWTVQRRVYALKGEVFKALVASPVFHVKSLAKLPEFRGGLAFASCTIARVKHL